MAKVFNVDALTKVESEIVLNGKTHAVVDMSVEGFLATMKDAEALEKAGNDISAQINALVKTILRAIPTLDEQELRQQPLQALYGIASFVRGEIPEGLKEMVSEKAAEGEEKNETATA